MTRPFLATYSVSPRQTPSRAAAGRIVASKYSLNPWGRNARRDSTCSVGPMPSAWRAAGLTYSAGPSSRPIVTRSTAASRMPASAARDSSSCLRSIASAIECATDPSTSIEWSGNGADANMLSTPNTFPLRINGWPPKLASPSRFTHSPSSISGWPAARSRVSGRPSAAMRPMGKLPIATLSRSEAGAEAGSAYATACRSRTGLVALRVHTHARAAWRWRTTAPAQPPSMSRSDPSTVKAVAMSATNAAARARSRRSASAARRSAAIDPAIREDRVARPR